ncbi:MAG: hypothetical protein J5J06_00890 [Phycisphaerae bacterium]|nr:hypothetical protein [Phycisphaerae bacterium]
MGRIWAVARQTISEGIRMRVAVVFLLLMAATVLGLPFFVEGDDSLTGAVQTFMSYSLMLSGFLLSLLSIFMARSLSAEIVDRQLFLIVTKPIPRWQFLLGKWMGICLLNGTLLFLAGLGTYGMVQFIRATRPPLNTYDKSELDNQVLVARHAIQATLPDFGALAEQEYERNREQGLYDNMIDTTPEKIKHDLKAKYEARWRVVAPLERRVYQFENVLCSRSPDDQIQLRYYAQVSNYPPDEIYRAEWIFGDPLKGAQAYRIPTRHVAGRFHVIPVPADAVAPDHTLQVMLINANPFADERLYPTTLQIRKTDGIEVLFVVGSFEGNLLRLLILMQCKLMFLAAVALLFASVFSFPVACLASFTVFALASMRGLLEEAFDQLTKDFDSIFASVQQLVVTVIARLYDLVMVVLPDFQHYSAIETLVNGRNVTLYWVLQGMGELVLLKTALALGIAMLVFQRREVAETSI